MPEFIYYWWIHDEYRVFFRGEASKSLSATEEIWGWFKKRYKSTFPSKDVLTVIKQREWRKDGTKSCVSRCFLQCSYVFQQCRGKAEEISTATINKLYYRKFAKKMQTFCFSLIVCVCTSISWHLFPWAFLWDLIQMLKAQPWDYFEATSNSGVVRLCGNGLPT